MAIGPQLSLRQQQRLVITPALRQSLFLLQVPSVELTNLVQQELMENPFLQEWEDGEAPKEDGEAPAAADAPVERTKELSPETPPAEEAFSMKEWQDYFSSESSDLGYPESEDRDEQEGRSERVSNPPKTLADHLLEQLQLAMVEDPVQEAARVLIGNLDLQGYLQVSLEELAQTEGLSRETLERGLTLLQTFEPLGVGARDLQECLLIQLRELQRSDSLAARIVRDCWEDFGHKRWHAVAKRLGVTLEDVLQAVAMIGQLNPKPARNYSQDPSWYVTPDVVLEEMDGRFVIRINDDGLPLLRINRRYLDLLRNQQELAPETKKFVEDKLQSAIWLVKGIEQRKRNLYRVTEAIVEFQRAYFSQGVESLHPLTLQEVADRVGLHESTVSRVTMHKYIQTPRGILPMKFFFAHAVSAHDHSGSSVTMVKEVLRDLMEEENAALPLSDAQLVAKLGERGITVARRTVAKYREELGRPPASARRRQPPGTPVAPALPEPAEGAA